MTSIIYIGMDVHTTNYTLCCYTVDSDDAFAVVNVKPDYHEILKYMERVRSTRGGNCDFICGYEAGCLGYSLYHQLAKHGVACIILAPSTMPQQKGKSIKTDKRDAKNIAKCLAFNLYSPVYVPTAEDDAIKEYIRMRDDVKADLKRTKQQIISFCTRHGFHYEGKSRWTQAYFKWLDSLVFENALYKETLQEYLALYYTLDEKIAVYDARIEELAHQKRYEENVRKLCCFKGVSTHTALPLLVEVGDFHRFRTAQHFSAYLGLVPGESSSGEKVIHTNITKAGNSHLRTLLVESANSYWVLRVAEDWLKPVYEELHRRLLQRQVLHADETTLQVLKLEGRTARSKCYMWLYRTGGDAEHPIVLYEYRPTRKAENAAAFLEGFSGWLHADGYAGYHRLPENIRVVGCWAHLRRKFDEAVNALPKEQRAGCAALEGLE